MIRFFAGIALVLAVQATANAQSVDPNDLSVAAFDPDSATAPSSVLEGPGVKVGQGTVLRPVLGIETGYVSNVYYEQANPKGAGLLRLIAQIGSSSLSDPRLQPGDAAADKGSFQYRADLRVSYDLLYSGDQSVSSVNDTGGLGLGASLHGLANPMGRFSFGVDEDFLRLLRAANFETNANTNRDINNLQLKLLYHPVDHSIGGYLYYVNTIDIFERSSQQFADRMFNRLGIHPTWQWLPQTQVYADISEGIVTSIGSSSNGPPAKATSYPLTAIAGLATLFSIKTTFNLYGGYTNGFYSRGPNFSAPIFGAALGYRYSPLGRATLQYNFAYQDSINANYYRDHILQLSLQQVVSPVVFLVQPEVHLREYQGVNVVQGPPTRDDVIFAVVAGVHYSLRNWLSVGLNYRFTTVQTNYRYMPLGGGRTDDPSYVRHELLLGVRAAL
jgi:hypothetical protein